MPRTRPMRSGGIANDHRRRHRAGDVMVRCQYYGEPAQDPCPQCQRESSKGNPANWPPGTYRVIDGQLMRVVPGVPPTDQLPNARDCIHGQLARSCLPCELLAERDALRAEVERLTEVARGWEQACHAKNVMLYALGSWARAWKAAARRWRDRALGVGAKT